LTAGENASIVANPTAEGAPTLTVLRNPTSSVPKGKTRVILHRVTDDPGVDVYAGSSTVVSDPLNPDQATFAIHADTLRIKVDVANSTTTVMGPATLNFTAGTMADICATGVASSKTLAVALERHIASHTSIQHRRKPSRKTKPGRRLGVWSNTIPLSGASTSRRTA
jgi:hypothetical protein